MIDKRIMAQLKKLKSRKCKSEEEQFLLDIRIKELLDQYTFILPMLAGTERFPFKENPTCLIYKLDCLCPHNANKCFECSSICPNFIGCDESYVYCSKRDDIIHIKQNTNYSDIKIISETFPIFKSVSFTNQSIWNFLISSIAYFPGNIILAEYAYDKYLSYCRNAKLPYNQAASQQYFNRVARYYMAASNKIIPYVRHFEVSYTRKNGKKIESNVKGFAYGDIIIA